VDPAGWTASGFAAGEAAVIVGLVARRRRSEHGRRVHLVLRYSGRDTLDETETENPDETPPPV
jgi:hypothetical protein